MLSETELKNRFEYDPITGLFVYKIAVAQMRPGDIAGATNTNGHRQIMINNEYYLAHNLAWLYMLGVNPPIDFIIDHKDGNYDNNIWENLRPATLNQNQGNAKLRCDNSSGSKGVHYDDRKRRYIAQITIKNKRKHIGTFKHFQDAENAYRKAAIEYFGEFARWN